MTRPPPACAEDGLGWLLYYLTANRVTLSYRATTSTGSATLRATGRPATSAGAKRHCVMAAVTAATSPASRPDAAGVIAPGRPDGSTTNSKTTVWPGTDRLKSRPGKSPVWGNQVTSAPHQPGLFTMGSILRSLSWTVSPSNGFGLAEIGKFRGAPASCGLSSASGRGCSECRRDAGTSTRDACAPRDRLKSGVAWDFYSRRAAHKL